MSPNVPKKGRAALLLAQDELTDEAIADEVGIQRRTLTRWKHDPDFAALVGDNVGRIQAGMLRLAIAKKHKRLEVLDDIHDKALQVIGDRAERHAIELGDEDTPVSATRRIFGDTTPAEAATGLMVKKETVSANGMKSVEWSVDVGLIREIRALHKQAAQELGQWEESLKVTHGGQVDHRLHNVRLHSLSDDALDQIEAILTGKP